MLFRILSAIAFAAVISLSSAHAATKIDDPVKFVKDVYADYVGKKPEPDDIYSPRLEALFALDTKEAGGEVGRIDFDPWIDAQDGTITGVSVTSAPVDNAPGRKVVIARFKNEGKPHEVHFYFERTGGQWKLDDMRSMTDKWVLSLILKYGWTDDQPN